MRRAGTTSRATWCRAEGIRRRNEELAARVAVLQPADEFDDDYAAEEVLAQLLPDADPERTGPESQTVRGVLCGACAGWRKPPTSREFYEAVQAAEPTARQLSIVEAIAVESSSTELMVAHLERAFTWRQLVRSLQLRGWCPAERANQINQFRRRTRIPQQSEAKPMLGTVIEAERALRERLKKSARRELGPTASETDVEALTDEAYWGPQAENEYKETDAEQQEREQRRKETIATMERWGL